MNDIIGENLLDFKRPKLLNFLKACCQLKCPFFTRYWSFGDWTTLISRGHNSWDWSEIQRASEHIIWLPLHKSSLRHNLCHIWCYPSEGLCSPEDQILQSKYRLNNMKSTQQSLGCRRVEEPYNSWREQYTILEHFCGAIGSGTFWSFGASPNCSTAGAQPAVCSFHLWWACEGSTFLHIFSFMTFKIITLLLPLQLRGCLRICQVSKFVAYGLCLSSLCNISLEMKLHHSMAMSNYLWSSSMTWSHSGISFLCVLHFRSVLATKWVHEGMTDCA